MTRNSLLKEYVGEIERLKADLLAAREKNGIYVSEETWNQLNNESELKETELLEARKQVEIIENQMRNVRDEYDQSIALLKRREEELHETTTTLHATERILREREVELKRVTAAYGQEVIVRQAHQETESALNGVALGLKNVATQGLRDVEGLFEKLGGDSFFFFLSPTNN
jgi:kinesin family protein 11